MKNIVSLSVIFLYYINIYAFFIKVLLIIFCIMSFSILRLHESDSESDKSYRPVLFYLIYPREAQNGDSVEADRRHIWRGANVWRPQFSGLLWPRGAANCCFSHCGLYFQRRNCGRLLKKPILRLYPLFFRPDCLNLILENRQTHFLCVIELLIKKQSYVSEIKTCTYLN